MIVDAVTARYAEALYRLAAERGGLEAVRGGVEQLAAEIAEPRVSAFLFDARVPATEKRSRLERLTQTFHPLLRNLVGLLFDKHREEVLRGLGPAFRQRYLAGKGAVEGRVQSARPLSQADIDGLAGAVGKRISKEVLLENEIDADLVGGVRVLVDNRLVDHSVRGRLAGMRKRLSSARVLNA
ncbi:MAG: ATP synthase F1 subunit delta [Planctomycetota bacterium]|nr:ATP synthase F1 subunit delta [Planctomycetota bacterium]MDP6761409.1 ATP synthase F1 subunit delta [Planctomycetota bacterium]MDP6987889.1 ATP synthase F1 subunit delta [Planctomycetota bacterium]